MSRTLRRTTYRRTSGPVPGLLVVLLAGGLAAGFLMGCEEDVTAVVGIAYPFEIYGVLVPNADTQKVRVFPIEGELRANTGAPLDADVASVDLETGTRTPWRDSLVAYENGTYGYLFWALFRPAGGRRYRIEVTRSDGARSQATVLVPRLPEVLPPAQDGGVTLPILFDATTRLRRVAIDYDIKHGWCAPEIAYYTLPHTSEGAPFGDRQAVGVSLREEFDTLQDSLLRANIYNTVVGIIPRSVTVQVTATDEGWDPPGGVFDPDVLIEPGVLSNVENGFGFIGSGYVWTQALVLQGVYREPVEPSDFERAGFTRVAPTPPVSPDICVPYP